MFFGCKHEWEIVTERREKSEWINRFAGADRIKLDSCEDAKDTYILVLKCTKCGKLDKTVERV